MNEEISLDTAGLREKFRSAAEIFASEGQPELAQEASVEAGMTATERWKLLRDAHGRAADIAQRQLTDLDQFRATVGSEDVSARLAREVGTTIGKLGGDEYNATSTVTSHMVMATKFFNQRRGDLHSQVERHAHMAELYNELLEPQKK